MLELNGNFPSLPVWGILHSASISNPTHGSEWMVQILSTPQHQLNCERAANELAWCYLTSFAARQIFVTT